MPALRLDMSNEIAVLTFDTNDSGDNILSDDVLLEFKLVLREMQFWPRAHGLIFCSGKAGTFCVGGDLDQPASVHLAEARVRRGLSVMASVETLPFPTVAIDRKSVV